MCVLFATTTFNFVRITSLIFLLCLIKIKKYVDNFGFRKAQIFVCDEQAYLMMDELIDTTPALAKTMETEEQRKAWKKMHINLVCSTLNEKRGYIGNRLKKCVDIWIQLKHGGKIDTETFANFPSVADIKRCVERDLDLTIPNNAETTDVIKESPDGFLFWFYWEHILPKTIGRVGWNPNVRHYATITNARFTYGCKSFEIWGVCDVICIRCLHYFHCHESNFQRISQQFLSQLRHLFCCLG